MLPPVSAWASKSAETSVALTSFFPDWRGNSTVNVCPRDDMSAAKKLAEDASLVVAQEWCAGCGKGVLAHGEDRATVLLEPEAPVGGAARRALQPVFRRPWNASSIRRNAVNMFVTSDAYLLQLLRDGKVDAEIAVRLGIREHDLRIRIEQLCRSAGVSTRDELRLWIETVDTAEWVPDDAIATPEPPALPAPKRRRSPVIVGTAASMAAAMLGLVGLVNIVDHPAGEQLAPVAIENNGTIPASIAGISSAPAPIGPDFHPERAIKTQVGVEPRPLPAGSTIVVEVGERGHATSIDIIAMSDDALLSRSRVLHAPANGEVTSTAMLPTGAVMFAAICDGGVCDSRNGAGDAWTTFYRSDNGGETWIAHSELDGRWDLVGIDNGRFVANRDDGTWTPLGAETLADQPVAQWHQKLALLASNRDVLASTGDPRPIVMLPMGGGGQIASAWWMQTETAITWTPSVRPGSTYYTGIYGRAYANPIAEFETGSPLDVRGRLAPGLYAANTDSGAPVILSAEDGSIAPIAQMAGTRILIVIPK